MKFPLLLAFLSICAGRGFAQDGPAIHRLDRFMHKGAREELDQVRTRHRLSLREIEKEHLDGKPVDIKEILGLMASYEKLSSRVEEPSIVQGNISVSLPANSMGEEAYSTCFCALTYNGLTLAAIGDELVLVRPEKQPKLKPPKRLWDRKHILSTQLFHLGYLNPDAVMRRYHDEMGTEEGHVISQPASNTLIVVDAEPALEKLRDFIDSEIMEAMGVHAARGRNFGQAVRPPSLGAIASREAIHFYLMAYARCHSIPLVAEERKEANTRKYPEADLWTSEQGYGRLEEEYRRINRFVQLARETAGLGWVDPNPDRTLSPDAQKRRSIRFGLVSPLPGRANAQTAKKTTRRKR